jgi:hypothetical protein
MSRERLLLPYSLSLSVAFELLPAEETFTCDSIADEYRLYSTRRDDNELSSSSSISRLDIQYV